MTAVACTGCWMPVANQVLGCPRNFLFVSQNFVHENVPYSSRKISDDLVLVNFQLSDQFLISRKFAPWIPLLFYLEPTFFTETGHLDALGVDARCRRTNRPPAFSLPKLGIDFAIVKLTSYH